MTAFTPLGFQDHREAYLQALQTKLQADQRIRVAWLEGSLGRGQADRYSDIDLHLLLDEADFPGFTSGAGGWLADLQPLVLLSALFGGHMINALTVTGIRIDLWPHQGQMEHLDPARVRVLHEQPGRLALDLAPPAPDPATLDRQLLGQTCEFWRCIALLPAAIGRDERLVAFSGLAVELGLVTDLLIGGAGTLRDRGVKHLNAYLPDGARAQLEALLSSVELSGQALVDAHLQLAALVRQQGPRIAERYAYGYPHDLERVVLTYTRTELEALGLDCGVLDRPAT